MTTSRKLLFSGFIWSIVCSNLQIPAVSKGSSIIWTKSAPLPEPRANYAAGVIDGKLVVAGGTYWQGSKGRWTKKLFSSSTHAFDPVTQMWERLPDLPTPLACAASTVLENKLFVLGGYTGSATSRKIFTLSKEGERYVWRVFADLPFPRVFATAASNGRRLYLLGGVTRFEPYDEKGTCCTSKTATMTCLALDTGEMTKGWRQLAPIPGARRWFFSSLLDRNSIWIFGGRFQEDAGGPISKFNHVFRYDIWANRWEAMPPLPEENPEGNPPIPVFVEDRIILISDVRKVWELNPATLEYSDLPPLPEAALVDKFVWLKNRIVGAGGENTLEASRRRSDWTFVGQFRGSSDKQGR
jgi:N-acetylneuraminic acid mutarotase